MVTNNFLPQIINVNNQMDNNCARLAWQSEASACIFTS